MTEETSVKPWTTKDELTFIDGIGLDINNENANRKISPIVPYTVKQGLKRYLKFCKIRHNWGDIDKEVVVKYATTKINKG
jgi:hypothetical protein